MRSFPMLGVIVLLNSCMQTSVVEIDESDNHRCDEYINAVDQSEPNELYLLGTVYATDAVNCKDLSRAEEYYAISAGMGHVLSQSAMCILSQQKEDYVDAVMWCILAAKGGHEPSKKRLEQYNDVLDKGVIDTGISKAKVFKERR